jgi:L-rhamnose mutarotase
MEREEVRHPMTAVRRRVCFTLSVDPDRLEEYRRRHAEVWPEMLAALRDAGWHDYALFLREDGLLVGHLATDDFEAAQAAMERTDVNARWQAEMAPFFTGSRPDRQMHVLDEVFNLDAQLERAGLNGDQR